MLKEVCVNWRIKKVEVLDFLRFTQVNKMSLKNEHTSYNTWRHHNSMYIFRNIHYKNPMSTQTRISKNNQPIKVCLTTILKEAAALVIVILVAVVVVVVAVTL